MRRWGWFCCLLAVFGAWFNGFARSAEASPTAPLAQTQATFTETPAARRSWPGARLSLLQGLVVS